MAKQTEGGCTRREGFGEKAEGGNDGAGSFLLKNHPCSPEANMADVPRPSQRDGSEHAGSQRGGRGGKRWRGGQNS